MIGPDGKPVLDKDGNEVLLSPTQILIKAAEHRLEKKKELYKQIDSTHEKMKTEAEYKPCIENMIKWTERLEKAHDHLVAAMKNPADKTIR